MTPPPALLLSCLRVSTDDAQEFIRAELAALRAPFVAEPLYTYAPGAIPLLLVAHTDTVHRTPPDAIYHDPTAGVLWSPDGLGADDRAGVYAILSLLSTLPPSRRPHVLLTDGEETGAHGARAAAADFTPRGVRAVIQIDRRGANDAVYYDLTTPCPLTRYIARHGYREAMGSFSDISILCPAWGVAGVNLSAGYRQEHSTGEHLFLGELEYTIARVGAMLAHPPKRVCHYLEAPPARPLRRRPCWDNPLDEDGQSGQDDTAAAWLRWQREEES